MGNNIQVLIKVDMMTMHPTLVEILRGYKLSYMMLSQENRLNRFWLGFKRNDIYQHLCIHILICKEDI